MITELTLRELLQKYLADYQKHDASHVQNAKKVRKALRECKKEITDDELINWWKEQDLISIASLQSYMMWMWTSGKIEYQVFENAYETLTPVLSKSWSVPVQITTGLDLPLLDGGDGGFLNKRFSIFQYEFSPSNHGFVVKCQEYPPPIETINGFNFILAFLSFFLDKYGYGYLGFQQAEGRKWTSSERATYGGGVGPTIRQDMIDFDPEQVEGVLSRIKSEENEVQDFSLRELLNVRHRAVLDSSFESKLITLWSAIEAQWGDEEKEDFLLAKAEKDEIEKSLTFLSKPKLAKVMEQIGRIKNRTKNSKIIEEIQKMDCVRGWDVHKTIQKIHGLRSKFAHGGIMEEKDVEDVTRNISFLMQIFDELISRKFSELNIIFNPPQ